MFFNTAQQSAGFYCVPSVLAIPALILDQLTDFDRLRPSRV